MAKKKTATTKASPAVASRATKTNPSFPYTTVPNALRGFLSLVPNKPRPQKVSGELIGAWGFEDKNAATIIKVLKEVDLLDSSGNPTDSYTSFMQPKIGPAVLGNAIRARYSPLFQASHEPFRENDNDLKRLFNIHSGGSDQTLRLQIQTFKTLCEFATFDGLPGSNGGAPLLGTGQIASNPAANVNTTVTPSGPAIHIDLHIHLPENKSARDYQAIIEDIARYIYRYEASDNG